MEGHQLVFLAGLHRSGTTLLARLLAAHPQVSGFSGSGAPADEGQHLQSVYPSDHEHGRPGRFGFAPEMHLTESSPLVSEQSAATLFEEWSPHWDLSRPLLLEKSPPNLLKTRFLQALFPNAAFVVLVRHWFRCHALFEADRDQLKRVYVTQYEQLVREPEAVLQGIFEFLELEPIAPNEPVEQGANEGYFRQWQDLKRDPRMRAYLDLASLWYERRVRRYGYSLLFPGRAV
jgi:hypothetical protein